MMPDLAAEYGAAVARLTRDKPAIERLIQAGIAIELIQIPQLVGIERVRIEGDCYEPDPAGGFAFLSPVCVGPGGAPEAVDAASWVRYGELTDIAAWNLGSDGWATRCGLATWLGLAEADEPFPVRLWRDVAVWLRAGCEGLVLLTRDPIEVRHVIGDRDVVAEDPDHQAELRQLIERPARRLPRISSPARRSHRAA